MCGGKRLPKKEVLLCIQEFGIEKANVELYSIIDGKKG
jgi:hypothetical protein